MSDVGGREEDGSGCPNGQGPCMKGSIGGGRRERIPRGTQAPRRATKDRRNPCTVSVPSQVRDRVSTGQRQDLSFEVLPTRTGKTKN